MWLLRGEEGGGMEGCGGGKEEGVIDEHKPLDLLG